MDIFRKQFVFLFTFKNKVFLNSAYRITLHDLKNKQSVLENILLRSISLEKFQDESFYKNLSRFDDEFIKCTNRAVTELLQFIFVLEHINKSLEFPVEDENTNYEYVNAMLEEVEKKFKDVYPLIADIENQWRENSLEPPQALQKFIGCFSLLSTDNNGKTFEISSNKFDEVISLAGDLIVGISKNMLIYIKNQYGD